MPSPKGRRRSLPLPRRWIADLMAFARGIPYVGIERRMDVGEVAAARAAAPDPLPWPALFLKAFGLVAARTPPLRWAYLPYPWPHLYETDECVASVAVAREYDGVPAVFPGLVRSPDRQSLWQLAEHLREFRSKPVEEIRPFARLIRYTRYPLPVRRLLWWLGLNVFPKYRTRTFGSFGLTGVGWGGADVRVMISPLPVCLTYGPLEPDGRMNVGLHFDHRVMDGTTAAAALAEVEKTLRGEVLAELRASPG